MVGKSQMGPMLTVREAARLLHIHSNTMRRWSDRGLIPAYRISPRGDRRFRRKDVVSLLVLLKPNMDNEERLSRRRGNPVNEVRG